MKNKNKVSIIVGIISVIIVIVGIIFLFEKYGDESLVSNNIKENNDMNNVVKEYNNIHSKNQVENNSKESSNEYNEQFNMLAENETNDETEKTILSITSKTPNNDNKINITNKDFELFKIMLVYGNEEATEEELKEEMLEYKIYSAEAQALGLEIPNDRMEDIEEIANSEEILGFIKNNSKAKDNFKDRIYKYLLDTEYTAILKDKILDEVSNNKVSISDETINEKMQEYIKTNEDFKKIENPTEEDRQQCFVKSYSLIADIQELYLENIKDKYNVDYE